MTDPAGEHTHGPAGEVEPVGTVGPAGAAGAVGPAGAAGIAGAVGERGEAGAVGPAGPAAPSASDEMVEELSLADRRIAFRVIDDLKTKIGGLTTAFNAVEAFAQATAAANAQATKAIRTALIVGLGVVLLLIGGLFLYDKQNETDDKAELNQTYLTNACVQGNSSRAEEKALWDLIFSEDATLSDIEGEKISKAEREALARIEDKIRTLYAQRDCTKVREGELGVQTPPPGTN